jgi:type I restriction enzyme S subunit
MKGEGLTTEAATYPRGFAKDRVWKWPMVPARKLITLNYGRALKADARSPGNVPVFGTNGQCGWHDAPLATAPGLILGRKGQGPLGVEWCDKDFWVIDTAYYASSLTPAVDLKYLYQLVKYIGLNHLKDGTSNPTLSRDTFGAQLFPLPPLAEQKAIAAVLGALDDKIELHRRMNATLESMARALFQSWFVDFDPVRAKLDGRKPAGMDDATAALFPDSFQDSELGQIPKGWTDGRLGDIGTNSRRGVRPSEIAPNTPYIALEHMPRRCIALGDWDESADVASGKSAFKKGEILFGKLRPYFHKVGVAPFDGVCSTDILVLAPKSPEWFGFLLGHASSDSLIQFTDLASTGTKMPRTNWSDVRSFKVALPPKPIAAAFTKIIQPMLDRIHANLLHSRTLATLRDTLLPKLLSGELSVENFHSFPQTN